MKIMKLKTKLEAVIGVLLLLAISVSAVHTITDDYVIYEPQTTTPTGTTEGTIYYNDTDNIFYGLCGATWKSLNESSSDFISGSPSLAVIRNSKNNSWAVTEGNLDTAIADVGTYGTVWIGDDLTLTSEIAFENRDGVILDFQGHNVTLSGDIGFINVSEGTDFAVVRNVNIHTHTVPTKSIIHLYTDDADSVKYNVFEKINIISESTLITNWEGEGISFPKYHNYTGIHLDVRGSFMEMNTFRDIYMRGCGNGILLENTATGTCYANGNTFKDIYISQPRCTINFTITTGNSENNQNLFENIKSQTCPYTEYGIKNVSGNGNIFDGCLMWDWMGTTWNGHATDGIYEWWVGDEAVWTQIINVHKIDTVEMQILDEGSYTIFRGAEAENWLDTNFVQPYDQTVFTNGTNFFVKNNETGIITTYTVDGEQAIEGAINSANGGTIFIKEGVYDADSYIAYTPDMSDITIIGESKHKTIIKVADGSNATPLFNFNARINVTLRGLTLDGNYDNNNDGNVDGIGFLTSDDERFGNFTIEDCIIKNFGRDGIRITCYAGETVTNVRIINCDIYNCHGYGIFFYAQSTGSINDAHISNNHLEGNTNGMKLDHVNRSTVTFNNIIGGTTGIIVDDTVHTKFIGNTISGATLGIDEQATTDYCFYSGNDCLYCTNGYDINSANYKPTGQTNFTNFNFGTWT